MSSFVIIFAVILALFTLERFSRLRRRTADLQHRLVVNIIMGLLLWGVAFVTVKPAIHIVMPFITEHQIGLLNHLPQHFWLTFIIGFLLLDLSFYYWHRLNHQWKLLWRFHNVHHCDPDMDVTTSMRFHPVEIAYSAIFRCIQIVVIGVHPLLFIIYELCFQINTYHQHANVKWPIKIERILNGVLVTPRMHGIHHSMIIDEHNANYSTILSIWDRLHGTYRGDVSQRAVNIGIAGYSKKEDNRLLALLKFPFIKQRHYQTYPTGEVAKRNSKDLLKNNVSIAA